MKKHTLSLVIVLFLFAAMCVFSRVALSISDDEASETGDNGQKTLTIIDKGTGYRFNWRGDGDTGAGYVDGIGSSSCDTIEILKATVAGTATEAVAFTATASWFVVTAQSTNPDVVWHLPGTTDPTALTGVESLQGGSSGYPARGNAVTFYNPDAAQATMTVRVCY